jgi:hypothetical protein
MASDFRPQRGQWYEVRLVVRGAQFSCYVDGQLLVQGNNGDFTQGHVAIGTTASASRFRNISITSPRGKVLWRGIPTLP